VAGTPARPNVADERLGGSRKATREVSRESIVKESLTMRIRKLTPVAMCGVWPCVAMALTLKFMYNELLTPFTTVFNPHMSFDLSTLPIAQLESLKFKANQIIESIQALQRTIEAGHQNAMPAWPDILSKYNILLSQTHNFSTSLVTPAQSASLTFANVVPRINSGGTGGANPYERIVLHPSVGMTDTQLDNEVIPLLRNQQTMDVLRMENDTVRRLSEHMATRGSLGVLGGALPPSGVGSIQRKPEYEDVLRECEQIKGEHDQRVERAVRAVTMLRDKFDWKQRVVVEVEEPEELDWDPRIGMQDPSSQPHVTDRDGDGESVDGDGDVGMDSPEAGGDGGSSDEDEVEGELVDSSMGMEEPHTPPSAQTPSLFSFGAVSVTATGTTPGAGGDLSTIASS